MTLTIMYWENLSMNEEKKLNLPQSLILLLLIIISVAICIRLKTGGPMIGLFASWIFIYLFCKAVRIPYDHVVSGDCLLFKGSNSMGLSKAVAYMKEK